MERQIKFRGKHIKNGAWLYGDLLQSNEGSVYIGVHGQYINKPQIFKTCSFADFMPRKGFKCAEYLKNDDKDILI